MQELGAKQVQLWLDPLWHENLRQMARAECTSMAKVVKRLVIEGIKASKHLSTVELARRAKAELENKRW